MSGLENMKRQILDEANHSAEEQIGRDFKRSKRADGGTERSHG